jgi:ligand-binding sensor domain-containing protein/anti-sigma regulatory factor (Ser/Thr protein kinase)
MYRHLQQKAWWCILTYLFLWGLPVGMTAQVSFLQTQFYSLNDGLSNRTITDIHQNKEGFLWIATPNGLNRFDGYQFKVLNDNPENPYQISESGPTTIAEDKWGNLVLTYSTNSGIIDLLDPKSMEVKKIELLPEFGIRGLTRQIKVSKDGEIYILTLSRNTQDSLHLFTYRPEDGERPFRPVFSVAQKERTSSTAQFQVLPLIDGSFLIGNSEKGIRIFNPKGDLLHEFESTDFENVTSESIYQILHEDSRGNVWVSFENQPGLYLWDRQKNPEQYFQLYRKIPTYDHYASMWEDKRGNLLVEQQLPVTQENIFLYCLTPDGAVQDFSFILDVGTFLVTLESPDFFKTLYVAIDTGLKIVQNNRYKVNTYLAASLNVDQRGKLIRGITDNGRDKVFFAREVFHWYSIDLETHLLDTITLRDPETDEALSFNCGLDVEIGPGGHLWGILCDGSSTGILVQYDTTNCTAEFFDYSQRFSAMCIANDNARIWLGSSTTNEKGLLVSFDPYSGRFTEFKDQEGNNPFRDALPRFILESSDTLLWVGTENGLFKIDPQSRTASRFHMPKKGSTNGLPSDIVYEIHEAPDGKIWLGTTNGLSIYDREKNTFKNYNTTHGLASNTICGIIPNGDGNYWISTFDGLSYFDTRQELFRNFYREDGFSHDEFNRFSYHKGVDGRIYLGGVNGLNVFAAEDLLVYESVPPVILTQIKKYNYRKDSNIVLETNLDKLEQLVISPNDNFFQVYFTLPDFSNPLRNQFQVMLEGYEKSWTYLGNSNFVRYSKLPPDDYILKIKGADANGNWGKEVLRLPIRVKPKFTSTWLFYGLLFTLIGGATYLVFQYQLEQRLKVERIRTKLSSDLHDEVTGLLSGIAMQTDVLQMHMKDEKTKERIQRIGEVSRKAISKMSDVIWSIDSRKDKVGDLLERMQEHADDVLVPLKINYTFKIHKIERTQKIPVHIRQDVYFIFKEAINNIAKHSNASEVRVYFGNHAGKFELQVEDNGALNLGAENRPLFNPPTKSHKKGQGLANLQMRADRINAELQIRKHPSYCIQLRMRKFA